MTSAPDLRLLFSTDAANRAASFHDVIGDGLEGELDDRIPDLLVLLHSQDGASALKAAVMLTSWGHPEAFQTLERWSRQPTSAPWTSPSLVHHRHSGANEGWAMLADAIRTSRYAVERPGLESARISALRSLLSLTLTEDFDRSLATTISSIADASSRLATELETAILSLIEAGPSVEFDRPFQAALLNKELARTRPEQSRLFAQRLIDTSPSQRARRELLDTLNRES